MLFIHNNHINNPEINLAVEEFLLRNKVGDEPILLFYINEPSVIIGRNQNTFEEIDPDFVKENDVHVIRRLSGGGAVFHDLGNLNFSFITRAKEDLHNFAKFTDPVISALNQLGIKAQLKGKSDIFVDGKKVSGNAQYSTSKGMFSHGTLLFDTNLETMLKALNPGQNKIESKAVQSIRNFVTNIKEHLPSEKASTTIYDLEQVILDEIFGSQGITIYQLTETDWEAIYQISVERYQQWHWNYGHSPKFNVHKSADLPVGKLDMRIDVAKGKIQGLKIYGNFSGDRPIEELERLLVGVRYDTETLMAVLADEDIRPYFGDLNKEDFLTLLS